ncbi:MAG: outer membrane protein assembly factor BamB family protein [Aureliella sp.]
MPAKQFIDQLEAQGLLAPEIVEELRRQVEESKSRITPATLARLLVDSGHLTKFQATKLVSELSKDAPTKAGSGRAAAATPKDDELDLAPLEDSANAELDANKALIIDDEDDQEITDVEIVEDPDEVEVVEVLDDDEPVDVVEVVEVVDDEVEAVPVEVVGAPKSVKRIRQIERSSSSSGAAPKTLRAPITRLPKTTQPTKSGSNPWESHRILTVGVVLAVLLVAASLLVWYFLRGNADALLAQAEESYKPNNYELALKKYESFAESFSGHPQASFARVRAGLARMRKDIEGLPDPTQALATAEDVLPKIVKEPALAGERGDVAGALVLLAQKFNSRADSIAETSKKKALMASAAELDALINDAQYVGNTARQQNAIALARIEEDRQRILRDISRDEELQAALANMDAKLKENATAEAYQIRRDLINRFPQLETEPSVLERIAEATRIQQSLVVAASPDVKTQAEAPEAPQIRTVGLANRVGRDASALDGRVLIVRAKGSVYGLDGLSGAVKWRYYIGRDMSEEPVLLSQDPVSDAVVCRPELGQLTRLDGATGKVKWFSDLGGAAHAPHVDGEDMLVSLRDGQLLDLDPESGQLKWAVQLPQAAELSPAVNAEKPNIYLPGDHSNLYVLSRQDGKCQEVYYLGHRSGTIAVPPVHLLGQLFVFENRTSGRSYIRILQTDDAGLKLTQTQDPIEVEGNIVTPPLIDGRKVVVLSDRGQIKVLDIEPTSEKNKVSVIVSEVPSESKPTITWGVSEGNQLWMANYRFTRWDIQVSTSKLVRPWIRDDGDQFVGPPKKYGDCIVHARVVRGTRGVRVSAVVAETGEPLWMTDLGVPISLVASPAPGKFDAITSSAAQFTIDVGQSLINKPETNPEGAKPGVLYENPRLLADGSVALNNVSNHNRLALYTPGDSGNRLKVITADFGGGQPTSPPAAVGESLAFGLDNGQMVLIDPTNGAHVATPFQPPVEPGRKHKWNQPVFLEETNTLFATDSRRKLYRIAVAQTLRSLADVDIEGSVLGPLATVGTQVVAVLSNQTDERLLVLDGTSLAKVATPALDGRWLSGPFPLSHDAIVVQTDRKLQAFGVGGAKLWEIDFPRVRLAAPPLVGATGLAIAATDGQAWLIDPANGQIRSELNAGQPLSAAPLAVPGGMMLGTDEGTVLLMRLSNAKPATAAPPVGDAAQAAVTTEGPQ